MRELLIDFNNENPLSGGAEAGYIGENNATKLVIRPDAELLGSGSSFFVAVFLSKGEIYRSEQFEPAEEIEIMLGAHLTQDHYLSVQLEGYSETDTLIYKSPMASKIHFMPSIEGKECDDDISSYQRKAQIELNTKSRHSHENADIINALGDSNGTLTYNGEPVGMSKKKESIIFSVENGEIGCSFSHPSSNGFSLINYGTLESFAIPQNAEIISVELQIADPIYPEWLDLKDMIFYDLDNPYILNFRSPFYKDYMVFLGTVYFTNNMNSIERDLEAYKLQKVRVTYTQAQES